MTVHTFSPIRTRRDLASIRDVFRDLVEGETVNALFSSHSYGNFTLVGPVQRAVSPGVWTVGGWFLNSGGRGEPEKELRTLTTTGGGPGADPFDDEAHARASKLLGELAEADVVKARFVTNRYGDFTITGPVRHTLRAATWVLAGWNLNTDGLSEPSGQLVELSLVSRAPATAHIPRVTHEDLGQGVDDLSAGSRL